MSTACCCAGLRGQSVEGEGGQEPEEKLSTQARILQEPITEDKVCLQDEEKRRMRAAWGPRCSGLV